MTWGERLLLLSIGVFFLARVKARLPTKEERTKAEYRKWYEKLMRGERAGPPPNLRERDD